MDKSPQKRIPPIDGLPNELLVQILNDVPVEYFHLVCKRWRDVFIQAHGEAIYHELLRRGTTIEGERSIWLEIEALGGKGMRFEHYFFVLSALRNFPKNISNERKQFILNCVLLEELPKGIKPTYQWLEASIKANNLTLMKDVLRKTLEESPLETLASWKKRALPELIQQSSKLKAWKKLALMWAEELPHDVEVEVCYEENMISLSISHAALFLGASEIANQLFSKNFHKNTIMVLPHNWEQEASIAFFLARTSLDTSVSADFETQFNKIFTQLNEKQQQDFSEYFETWIQKSVLVENIMKCHWKGINKDVLENPLNLLFKESDEIDDSGRDEVRYDRCNNSRLYMVYLETLVEELKILTHKQHTLPIISSTKLFSEVALLFALLLGNKNRIHHVIKVFKINSLELDSLSWMLNILSSLALSPIESTALEKGWCYLLKNEFPELGKSLQLPHLFMLMALGLFKSVRYIESVRNKNENFWEYIWETNSKESHHTLYSYFRDKTEASETFIAHEGLEERFLALIVEKEKYPAIDYFDLCADRERKDRLTELVLNKIEENNREKLEFLLDLNIIHPLSILKRLLSSYMVDVNDQDAKYLVPHKQEVSDRLMALNRYVKSCGPFHPEDQEEECFWYLEKIIDEVKHWAKHGLLKTEQKELFLHENMHLIDSILRQLFYFQQYPDLFEAITQEQWAKIAEDLWSIIIQCNNHMTFAVKGGIERYFEAQPNNRALGAGLNLWSEKNTQIQLTIGSFKKSFSLAAAISFVNQLGGDVFLRQQIYRGILELGPNHLAYQSLMILYEEKHPFFKKGLESSDERDREQYLLKHLIEATHNAEIEAHASSPRVTM